VETNNTDCSINALNIVNHERAYETTRIIASLDPSSIRNLADELAESNSMFVVLDCTLLAAGKPLWILDPAIIVHGKGSLS